MDTTPARRTVLRTGGLALVGTLAGCSGLVSEGKNPTALNVAMKNDLSERHRLRLEFSPNGNEDSFAKSVSLGHGEVQSFENVVPYPDGKSTATVVTQLDDEPVQKITEYHFSKKLEELRIVARKVDGEPKLLKIARNRSDDGLF